MAWICVLPINLNMYFKTACQRLCSVSTETPADAAVWDVVVTRATDVCDALCWPRQPWLKATPKFLSDSAGFVSTPIRVIANWNQYFAAAVHGQSTASVFLGRVWLYLTAYMETESKQDLNLFSCLTGSWDETDMFSWLSSAYRSCWTEWPR